MHNFYFHHSFYTISIILTFVSCFLFDSTCSTSSFDLFPSFNLWDQYQHFISCFPIWFQMFIFFYLQYSQHLIHFISALVSCLLFDSTCFLSPIDYTSIITINISFMLIIWFSVFLCSSPSDLFYSRHLHFISILQHYLVSYLSTWF